ncbi:MAG: site-specific DNA-methyltransferase [Firmicutes bacterium]|nr:site-specific DNA-methyltransferase [Bacillota bacterium]
MDRLKMHSVNKVDENIKKIAELFPNTLTEVIKGYRDDGTPIIEHAIDFDVLRQELSNIVVEGPEERYQFTWPDKKKSILLANAPIAKTLRPCREESVDFDTTENLYIEGDNLDALKLLQETYLGKVKMIYIDPPYNTGKDFIYEDDFAMENAEWRMQSGDYDQEGNRLVQNTESNGRFHTDWLNMMYPRLKLAKDLLSDDGVIFISIDDNEVENLKKICNEVFGEKNEIGLMTIQSNPRGSQASKHLSNVHEYILMYSKNSSTLQLKGTMKPVEKLEEYSEIDENGKKYRLLGLRQRGGAWKKEDRPNMHFPIYVNPSNGKISLTQNKEYSIEVIPKRPTGELSRWTWGKEKIISEINMIVGKRINRAGEENAWDIFRKDYLENVDGTIKTDKIKTIWIDKETNYQNAKVEIKSLFGNSEIFDFPKPTFVVERLASMLYLEDNEIVLDFFSGSATTAHAVMQLNAEDGGNRKFIMVQLPEPCDEKSEAYKAGYKTIAEIGKERIRRAGAQIIEKMQNAECKMMSDETKGNNSEFCIPHSAFDKGFRVLKVDSTNMQDVYYRPDEYTQDLLSSLTDNIKPGRTPEDLLFQVMLDLGVLLSSKIEEMVIGGKRVFSVADGYLMACFDNDVTDEVVREIAKRQPYYAVFRDSSLASDSVATNFEQIFATYSPSTIRKVL